MPVTYTTASQRDAQRSARLDRRFGMQDLLLIATSIVVVMAIGLAYAGRVSLLDQAEAARPDATVVNVNRLEQAGPLETAMADVVTNPQRREAAAAVVRF